MCRKQAKAHVFFHADICTETKNVILHADIDMDIAAGGIDLNMPALDDEGVPIVNLEGAGVPIVEQLRHPWGIIPLFGWSFSCERLCILYIIFKLWVYRVICLSNFQL